MAVEPVPSSCRAPSPVPVRWITTDQSLEKEELAHWCDAVGRVASVAPPVVGERPTSDPVIVASWNSGVGRGLISSLIDDLRSRYAGTALIVLMQEAYRVASPPAECLPGSRVAGRISAQPRGEDILRAATAAGMYAVYIPSMRNGNSCAEEPREDRGNAILSTLPLADVAAIELPFERERRVVVFASVVIGGRSVGLASTHFDTSPTAHRRHALGLVRGLETLGWDGPTIVAGDFNGQWPDPGIIEMRRHFREIDCGQQPTFRIGLFRLDHLFVSGGVIVEQCQTAATSHQSDHWPLYGKVSLEP